MKETNLFDIIRNHMLEYFDNTEDLFISSKELTKKLLPLIQPIPVIEKGRGLKFIKEILPTITSILINKKQK